MKRIVLFILIILLVLLCSCSINKATSFDYKRIDNGENNYLAGGKMAYKDNTLYLTAVSDSSLTSKTLAINNNMIKLLYQTKSADEYMKNTTEFYQIKDKVYICTDDWYELRTKDNSLKKVNRDEINRMTEADYFSESIIVKSVVYGERFKVKYKNKPSYFVKHEYQNLCVGNDKVYFVDFSNNIYCNNPTKGKGDYKYLTDTVGEYHSHLGACGGYLYYDAIGETDDQYADERADSGLSCYSEKDKINRLIVQGVINSINSVNDIMYVAAENGIYKCEKDKATKLCNEKADEIYILDNSWIYGLDNTNGKVFRVNKNGKTTELIYQM